MFVTSQGLFYYKVMPFVLKNAGVAYQRLMNKMFAQQIGRNVQVYVDDMLMKSRREEDHLDDLRETFDTLCSYNMKLNLGKCAFKVMAGKFLGFIVFQSGIKANPNKIRAIIEMAPPRNVKKVQSLNGKVAALNRFVLRETNKCLPFFHMLKKYFEWMVECQQELEDLKTYLMSPPLLSPSQPGEKLFLYLVVSLVAISAALVREEERVQKTVYYTKPYFQAHMMIVLTEKPLR